MIKLGDLFMLYRLIFSESQLEKAKTAKLD